MHKLLLGLSAFLVSTSLAAQGIDLTEWEDEEPELLQGGNATSIKKGYGGRMPSGDAKLERQLQHFDKMLQRMDQERAREKEMQRREAVAAEAYRPEQFHLQKQQRDLAIINDTIRRQQQAEADRQRQGDAWLESFRLESERLAEQNRQSSQAGVQQAEDWLNQSRQRSQQAPTQDPWAIEPFVAQPVEPVEVPYTPTPWPQ